MASSSRFRRGVSIVHAVVLLALVALLGTALRRAHTWMKLEKCHKHQRHLQQDLEGRGPDYPELAQPRDLRLLSEKLPEAGSADHPASTDGSFHYILMAGSRKIGCVDHGSPFLDPPRP